MHGDIILSRYWNSNGIGTAIVAAEGAINDIACYIGAQPDPTRQEDTLEWVKLHGVKLSKDEAYRFFPDLEKLEERGFHYRS